MIFGKTERERGISKSFIIFRRYQKHFLLLLTYQLLLTGYSLKAHSSAWSSDHFINSWVIEGSHDGENWSQVDYRNSDALHQNLAEEYFECKPSSSYQYFRIKLTSKNTSNNYDFALNAVEFFGLLQQKE